MFALPMFPALHSGSQGFKLLVVFQPIKMIKAILKKEKKKKTLVNKQKECLSSSNVYKV